MYFEKSVGHDKWAVVYDKAIREDGSLIFPERLSRDFLDSQRKTQGSYIFAHQYQNEIIPSDDQDFKKEWLVYYKSLPEIKSTYAFIDPAISLDEAACYTAFVVIDVDVENTWYLKLARRERITATQTIELMFDLHARFNCRIIGVEAVAYQMALMHFLDQEMRRRAKIIPVHAVKRGPDISKPTRIRSLVPRFEWQRILIKPGLLDFEDEYLKFPRGSYVDILDALSSLGEIASPPERPKEKNLVKGPNHPDYEREHIQRLLKQAERSARDGNS